MNEIVDQAANTPSGDKKFAAKEVNFIPFQNLSTLAQCVPDLSSSDCNQCLSGALRNLPSCCNGKQGGHVFNPSCSVRYEIYPFYNTTAVIAPPPAPVIVPPAPGSVTETKGNSGISTVAIVAIVTAIGATLVLLCLGFYFLRRRARKKYNSIGIQDGDGKESQSSFVTRSNAGNSITTVESLKFDLGTIAIATKNFAADNKLGEGGFGPVYKGTLPNGREIAVKRLSKRSGQGAEQFKNEVFLVAKLQHRNLVRLTGFCLEGEEKILIYEFVPNKSLDYFLFGPQMQEKLGWSQRCKIIGGIARGMLYLHEDSRLRIIHRDLKASNVLLDGDMNPKISDFGTARIFGVDQTQANTNRIVGTYGYMAPEYAMHGQFSVKSDAYSFGVLILEIITGKKNSYYLHTNDATDLLSHVWKHWRDGTVLEVLDPALMDSYSRNEVIKCIHIGLLCVQDDPTSRPTMATIILLLNSNSATLPLPQEPAYFLHSTSVESMPTKAWESDQSRSKSVPLSVDEESITEVHPR